MKQKHISGLFKDHNDTKDYSHLSSFLQNQIYRGTDKVKCRRTKGWAAEID